MRILGVDPGGTTGMCFVDWVGHGKEFTVIKSWEVPWMSRWDIYGAVEQLNFDVIVVESFRLYRHMAQEQVGSDFPSAQVIGAIEYVLFDKHTRAKLVYQPAANAKDVQVLPIHRDILGSSEHRKDAYKHIRYWILANQPK